MPRIDEKCLPSLIDLAHETVRRAIEQARNQGKKPICVDGTAGNGHDTLFLAREVGEGGQVFAFDVQPAAFEATRALLEEANLTSRVKLVESGHEHLLHHLPQVLQGGIVAALFNLGFLPGSDKRVTTQPDTTLRALDALLPSMAPGAALAIHLYSGHPGGQQEHDLVLDWTQVLPRDVWRVLRCSQHNKTHAMESLLLMEKM